MLKRIYIDNFRCLVNFEIKFDRINLFLGDNGSGKTSVFYVLRQIQEFVTGDGKVDQIFPPENCTRWQTLPLQRFELEIEGNGGTYKYELAIDHNRERNLSRVQHERLWFNNQPLIKFEQGEVQLYRDNHSEGPRYPMDWSRSILPFIMPRNDNTKLTWFKQRLDRFIIVQINPIMMADETHKATNRLSPYMENFVSWYRYLSQDAGKIFDLINALRDNLDGFDSLKFTKSGEESLILKSTFKSANGGNAKNHQEYRFGELSEGQRVLIALYALIHGTESEDYTLCLDEPDNFVALPEIQPWLIKLYDMCSEGKTQALLISHHPEIIDYLLASPVGYWFERDSNSPVRLKPISHDNQTGLPISELIARGWLNE